MGNYRRGGKISGKKKRRPRLRYEGCIEGFCEDGGSSTLRRSRNWSSPGASPRSCTKEPGWRAR